MCKSHPFGFHDQMSWALYPHRDLPSPSNHPSDTLLGRTTFYEPLPVELEYCKQLADWWAARQPRGNVNFTPTTPVDPIIPTPSTSYARSWSRQQRLISDATPDCEPQGYFDATVEVGVCCLLSLCVFLPRLDSFSISTMSTMLRIST